MKRILKISCLCILVLFSSADLQSAGKSYTANEFYEIALKNLVKQNYSGAYLWQVDGQNIAPNGKGTMWVMTFASNKKPNLMRVSLISGRIYTQMIPGRPFQGPIPPKYLNSKKIYSVTADHAKNKKVMMNRGTKINIQFTNKRWYVSFKGKGMKRAFRATIDPKNYNPR